MKRFSNIVLFGALANILVLMLFPPYDVLSMTDRGVRFFDAFHPVFSVPPNRTVNADILFFAIYGVVGNAVLSFVLLSRPQPIAPRVASGLPITAAFATAGWRTRQLSISAGPMR